VKKQTTRREFCKTLATSILGASLFRCSSGRSKPNLLFIWTDQQRADTMAVYGNKIIRTPNLNKLASESIVFEKAYVSQPVCTPSRSTVMTGLWPHTNGCTANNIPLSEDIPCFPELLNDPDYRTGYFGKWHLGDEIYRQHGFDEWEAIEDQYIKFYSDSRNKNYRSSYHHFLLDQGHEPDTNENIFSRNFVSNLAFEHSKPKFLEAKACRFLERHRNDPFILYVNFLEPHSPYNGPFNNFHDPEKIVLPENSENSFHEDDPLRYRLLQAKYRRSHKAWQNLTAKYYGLVSEVDQSVGKILMTLEHLGLAENTIVVFTSDHGDMMGSHNLLAKTVMYEEAVRVPLLMRVPWLNRRHALIKERVSHIDLMPTLLDLMNHKNSGMLPGNSLVERIRNSELRNSPVFIEWNPNHLQKFSKQAPDSIESVSKEERERVANARIRTVISPDGWKLSLSDHDKNQLFDLNKDPWETRNLYYTGQYAGVIHRLTKSIVNWQQDVDDESIF
jgi:arylsulfatase A-like enzyme